MLKPPSKMFDMVLNMLWVLVNMVKFWYGKALYMREVHNVLNMPEYTMTEFWIYLEFWIWQDSEYDMVLNMQDLRRVLDMRQCP